MMYIILLVLLILMLVITLIMMDKEILAPPVVVLLMFVLATTIGLLRWYDWELYKYDIVSVLLLVTGLLAFVCSSALVRLVFNKYVSKKRINNLEYRRIEIDNIILSVFILIGIISNISYYCSIKQIVFKLGFSVTDISTIINHFRNIVDSEVFAGQNSLPTITKALGWTITSIGMFTLFVFFHNATLKIMKKRDWWLLVPTVLWISAMLLNSHRSYILTALAECIYLVYFFLNMRYKWKSIINYKILSIGIELFIVLLALFLVLAVAIGRYDSMSEINIVDYLTVYISSGIRNFDIFVQEPLDSAIFGSETFASLFKSLNYRLDLGFSTQTHLEFRYIGDLKISNIYTAFRRYYADFGIVGLIVIPTILGGVFSYLYENIKCKGMKGIIDFNIIFFIYICKELFQMCIEETVLNFEVSMNGIFKIFVLYILYWFIVKKRIRIKVL